MKIPDSEFQDGCSNPCLPAGIGRSSQPTTAIWLVPFSASSKEFQAEILSNFPKSPESGSEPSDKALHRQSCPHIDSDWLLPAWDDFWFGGCSQTRHCGHCPLRGPFLELPASRPKHPLSARECCLSIPLIPLRLTFPGILASDFSSIPHSQPFPVPSPQF